MSDQKDRTFVRDAIDTGLESMQGNPFLAQRIINQERTEQPVMKKKISFAMILAMILLLAFTATAVAGAVSEKFNTWLYQIWPEAATTLMPVNMSCESGGVRMEIISAVAEGTDLYITYSMEDLEGDRLNIECSPVMYVDDARNYNWEASFEQPMKDEATGKVIFGEHFVYDGDITASDGVLTAHVPSFLSSKETATIDLFPYLAQYGGSVKTMEVPEDARMLWHPDSYEDLQSLDMFGPVSAGSRVLDTGSSLEIPLADTVYLSGIGNVDGMLHVQLHYVNHGKTVLGTGLNQLVFRPDEADVVLRDLESDYWYDRTYHDPRMIIETFSIELTEPEFVGSYPEGEESGESLSPIDYIGWGSQPDDPDTPEWVEFLFTTDAAGLNAEQQEFLVTIDEKIPIRGIWNAEIPVRLIRHAD